eukprot:5121587-Prymnesium_polylepis.1
MFDCDAARAVHSEAAGETIAALSATAHTPRAAKTHAHGLPPRACMRAAASSRFRWSSASSSASLAAAAFSPASFSAAECESTQGAAG